MAPPEAVDVGAVALRLEEDQPQLVLWKWKIHRNQLEIIAKRWLFIDDMDVFSLEPPVSSFFVRMFGDFSGVGRPYSGRR